MEPLSYVSLEFAEREHDSVFLLPFFFSLFVPRFGVLLRSVTSSPWAVLSLLILVHRPHATNPNVSMETPRVATRQGVECPTTEQCFLPPNAGGIRNRTFSLPISFVFLNYYSRLR